MHEQISFCVLCFVWLGVSVSVCIYIRAYIHACVHIFQRNKLHGNICIYAQIHPCNIYIYIYRAALIIPEEQPIHTHTLSTHTHIHAYMHTCIHAYMHTCIHAYMHTCIHAAFSTTGYRAALITPEEQLILSYSGQTEDASTGPRSISVQEPVVLPGAKRAMKQAEAIMNQVICVYICIYVCMYTYISLCIGYQEPVVLPGAKRAMKQAEAHEPGNMCVYTHTHMVDLNTEVAAVRTQMAICIHAYTYTYTYTYMQVDLNTELRTWISCQDTDGFTFTQSMCGGVMDIADIAMVCIYACL